LPEAHADLRHVSGGGGAREFSGRLVRLQRVADLEGAAPMDVAEAFRDLPGLALLESARPGRRGRWSLLTADPITVLESPAEGADPFAEARALLARLAGGEAEAEGGDPRGTRPDDRPPFSGGLVGYLGYDLGRRIEQRASYAIADQPLPELRLALHDWALAWDRRTGAAWLAGRALDGDAGRLDRRLGAVRERLDSASTQRSAAGPAPAMASSPAPASGSGLTPASPAAAAPASGFGLASASASASCSAPAPASRSAPASGSADFHAEPAMAFVSGTSRDEWVKQVEAVRAAIAAGEIYQANLTRRLETPFSGDPWPVFRRLRTGDPALFAGYLDLGADPRTHAPRALLSASPEPFLAVDALGNVATDPIKGTRPRGRTREQDRELARELLASRKDQAENVMIVDVLRNDLGRVCMPGTVRVPRLLRLERTAAVQHLVTTVTGRLRPGNDVFDLLVAVFPGGSITGAPKIRAMEVIERLEPVRRGPYCGAVLWLGADGRMGSSILIRTFVADGSRLTLHVGGGITYRSDPADEWDETVAKAHGPLSSIGAAEVHGGLEEQALPKARWAPEEHEARGARDGVRR
jgi:para-aminobenzoate synthetase component 1